MKPGKIRPLAICIFRHGDRILAAEGFDSVKQQTFYRPLGGRIEFGERGAETIIRELREEIKAEVTNIRYLGTLENIFTYEGQQGHEIVLVYDGQFTDSLLYERDGIEGWEDDLKLLFTAHWRTVDFFRAPDAPPLYPDGLVDLILTLPSVD